MARVLVTGATGFIGRHLVEILKRDGHEIIATGLRTSIDDCPWLTEAIYTSRDLSLDCDNYFEFFQRPDYLVHLAWSGLPNYNELFHIEKNLWDNYDFLKNMLKNGLSDLTVIGTCFEYGLQEGELSEEMPANPENAYAIAKDSLRRFLEQFQKQEHFDFKWLRVFYMYGEGQSERSLLSQLEKAVQEKDEYFNMSGGEQLRDYLPVEEIAELIVKVVLQQETQGIINCCSNTPISVKDLVEAKIEELSSNIKINLGYYPYSDNEAMAFWGSNKKILNIKKRLV
jgi:nucleoside-diphosphate-sugar epimerase